MSDYEITIGIECHVQLATRTKLFSRADNDARDKAPNQVISSVDYALPGTLPVLNKQAINLAVMAAKALNAQTASISRFDRKHYFYPDLPKGYQITQNFQPIIVGGHVEAPLKGNRAVRVNIHHAHLEEDAGKLTHHGDYSLVDLNRAGTPLIEIVSEPDMHSAEEAKAYAMELHLLMVYAGVTRGDLYHGNMRFDVNISVAKKGAKELGVRTEIKNLNSFRSIEKAVEYESSRQMAIIEKGGEVQRETLGWDDAKQKTISQRSKEEAADYRYMPDPDVPPVVLSSEYIKSIQSSLPKLPADYRSSWRSLELDESVVNTLLSEKTFADIVLAVQGKHGDDHAKRIAHWFSSALPEGVDMPDTEAIKAEPDGYVELSKMAAASEISSSSAKLIFIEMLSSNKSPKAIAMDKGLLQISDEAAIIKVVDEVLANEASLKAIADIKAGNDKAIGYLVGQVMKLSKGKANPGLAQKLMKERI